MIAQPRLGLRLPANPPANRSFGALCRDAEAAGWESLWVSEHLVFPADPPGSRYPYTSDGTVGSSATHWNEAVVAMSLAAASTRSVEVGSCVALLALRHPLLLAKQIATLSALTDRRVALGIGVGWLREEFDAFGVDFATRGARTDEAIAAVRSAWTGRIDVSDGEAPTTLSTEPRPAHPVPVLVGGMSHAAFRRAVRYGDGWIAIAATDRLNWDSLESALMQVRSAVGPQFRMILRARGQPANPREVTRRAAALGFTDLVVDIDYQARDAPHAGYAAFAA